MSTRHLVALYPCSLLCLLGLLAPAAHAQSDTRGSSGNYVNFGAQQMANIRQSAVGLQNDVAGIIQQNNLTTQGFRPRGPVTGSAVSVSPAPTFNTSRPASKPFANVTPAPTTSPYLSLFNTGIIGDEVDNYNTFVRPQIRQQQFNTQVQRQAMEINRRFQQLSARPAYNPQGAQNVMGTGHATFYGNTGRFYPQRR